MRRATTFAAAMTTMLLASSAVAQDKKEDDADAQKTQLMLAPSERDLSEDDQKRLRTFLDKELGQVVQKCVAKYPRPELFATLLVKFELRKSGEVRGGYVPSGAVDSNLYVTSDEERQKLEEQGSFTRLVVRSDRELERCLEKGTRSFRTGISGVSASVNANYGVKWKDKKASLEATSFEISK